jgi:hypothetical protein
MSSILSQLTEYVLQNPWIIENSGDNIQIKWLITTSGENSFHDNVLVFGFVNNNPNPTLVGKACRLPENGWMLRAEYKNLKIMWNKLGKCAAAYLPKPLVFMAFGKQPILLTNFIRGESFQQTANTAFWNNAKHVKSLMIQAAKSLREIHEMTSTVLEPGEVVLSDFPAKASTFMNMFVFEKRETLVIQELVEIVTNLTHSEKCKVMIQGDFWHGNLIKNVEENRLYFIDWQFARWEKNTSFDLFLFPLAAAVAAVPQGSATNRALDAAKVLHLWQYDILPTYFSSYGKPLSYTILPERQGMLLSCIEKTARSVTDFGRRHQDDYLWRNLFRELLDWPN